MKLLSRWTAFFLILVILVPSVILFIAFNPKLKTTSSPRINNERVPATPTLNNLPSTSDNGIVILTWQSEPALTTKIFIDSSEIVNVTRAILLATLDNSIIQFYTYTHVIQHDGMYYYAIVVSNTIGDSAMSNVVNTYATKPPAIQHPVILSIDSPTSTNGLVTISWTTSEQAIQYNVYRSNVFFFDTTMAIKIATVDKLILTEQITNGSGEYYYAVVAVGPNNRTSQLSNVVYVAVVISTPPPPPDFPIPVLMTDNFSSSTGIVRIFWVLSQDVISVDVYRATTSVDFLTNAVKVANLGNGITEFKDQIINGIWYYAIIMKYALGDSKLSNIININVMIPTPEPILGPLYLSLSTRPYSTSTVYGDFTWNALEGTIYYWFGKRGGTTPIKTPNEAGTTGWQITTTTKTIPISKTTKNVYAVFAWNGTHWSRLSDTNYLIYPK